MKSLALLAFAAAPVFAADLSTVEEIVAKCNGDIITRGDLGRKMTEAESGVSLFWQDNFTSEYLSSPNELELKDFRDTVFDSLKNATRHRA